MDIVFNVNDKYVPFLCATMLSVMEHSEKGHVRFHIFTNELSGSHRSYIEELVSVRNDKVSFYDVDVNLLKGFPIGKGTVNPQYPYTGYLRLLIPEIIDTVVEKALYLDCDIVVIERLDLLWKTDISNYSVAAVDDYGTSGETGIERLTGEHGYKYFNAGVLLLNVKRMRETHFFRNAQLWVKENANKVRFHDQDILNAVLYKERKSLDSKWNCMTNYGEGSIIHFASYKPWELECSHPQKDVFLKYLNQTQWGGMKLKSRYNLSDKMIMKLKRLVRSLVPSL